MLTRDDVFWAYRLFLGREPESESVIRAHQRNTWRSMCETFISSNEFQNQRRQSGDLPDLPIARFLDVKNIPVEVECSSKQEQEMFERIAAEWKKFGETEPHWSVLTHKDYRRENIDADKTKQFFESGNVHLERLLNCLRRSEIDTRRFSRALDFGCGVGRLSMALTDYADRVTGVDLSPGHLAEARKVAVEKGYKNIDFVQINSVADIDILSGFDLIISMIVLQHNPPPVMAAIYRKLLRSLAPGGVAVIQMPTYIHGQDFDVKKYLASEIVSMEMNALPQWKIFELTSQMGCRPLEIREDNSIGMASGLSHTFSVIKTH